MEGQGGQEAEDTAESITDHRLQTQRGKKGVWQWVHGLRKTERVRGLEVSMKVNIRSNGASTRPKPEGTRPGPALWRALIWPFSSCIPPHRTRHV